MLGIHLGFDDGILTFLLSTGGLFFVGMLLLAALVGLFRARRTELRIVCGVILVFCLLLGILVIWLSISFGGSSSPPTPIQP